MAGRATLWLGGIALLSVITYLTTRSFIDSTWIAVIVTTLVLTPLLSWAGSVLASPWSRTARALNDAIASLKDRDFSLSVTPATGDEMGDLVTTYNGLGERLRVERQSLYQRELMLDTVIQATPLALVLTNQADAVLYSNTTARQLFGEGRKLEGERFSRYLAAAPAPLQEAIQRGGDTLFTLEIAGEPQVYHVSQRRFLLNALPHRLLMLKQLTREINSQEVATWKKVIRVIAHELNNSLAPISSLAHSGQILARAPPDPEQLSRVFATIEDRARHLAGFIEGYAQFAKLPHPRLAPVAWEVLLERLRVVVAFRLVNPPPRRAASFDTAQIEQALINLLKNARESGSGVDEIELVVAIAAQGFTIEVRDRGPGFTPAALENALVPFYSTKETGTGLGLTLCREIVEAHGGRLRIANREGGGALVALWLPDGS
ncbi:MAG TPA: ATP-binding protein [Steroidobacteraceae bacterium]|jgi:nitrogen fixation/metabolism regulation signal transduction histidine kinase|nr:ATP-binding protein [Steroidobacteraceae bacterium]